MTDTHTDRKWFYRWALLLVIALLSYVVFQPSYNFAHWVPHSFLRGLGIPYSALLYFETHADKILHPLGAAIITVLLFASKVPFLSSNYLSPNYRTLCVVIVALFGTELIQALIGRGFDYIDLILGALGSYLACTLLSNR